MGFILIILTRISLAMGMPVSVSARPVSFQESSAKKIVWHTLMGLSSRLLLKYEHVLLSACCLRTQFDEPLLVSQHVFLTVMLRFLLSYKLKVILLLLVTLFPTF